MKVPGVLKLHHILKLQEIMAMENQMASLQEIMVMISGEVDLHLITANQDVNLLQPMARANSLLLLEASLLGITNGNLEILLNQMPPVSKLRSTKLEQLWE